MPSEEMKVYGMHACQALFKQRPSDIIRVYAEKGRVQELGPLLKWCAAHKKAYHLVEGAELEKITKSVHHEGICILAKIQAPLSWEALVKEARRIPLCLLYLDGVQNPHNLGALLRIAAHFGVRYILGNAEELPQLSASALRIAQGGAESVQLLPLEKPKEGLQALKTAGYALVATSSHAEKGLYECSLPERLVWIFGSESHGVSKPLLKQSSELLRIPGSGAVGSLNVSAAAAICLGEYWRQHAHRLSGS